MKKYYSSLKDMQFHKITKVTKLHLAAAVNSICRNISSKATWFVEQHIKKCEKKYRCAAC